jgi:hypothetical protein
MTGQAQRRRTTRSTTITTATSATTHTSTQIHSGMVRLLPRAGCGRTGCCHTSQVVVAGAERPPRSAAVRGPLPPPAAPDVPASCLPGGSPPGRRPRQGRPSLRDGLRPALSRSTRSLAERPARRRAGDAPYHAGTPSGGASSQPAPLPGRPQPVPPTRSRPDPWPWLPSRGTPRPKQSVAGLTAGESASHHGLADNPTRRPPRSHRARNGLHAALAGGTLQPPAPAVCLLDGLPPRPLRGQGSLRAPECSLRLRPAPRPTRPVHGPEPPVARGERGTAPDQQQREVRDG